MRTAGGRAGIGVTVYRPRALTAPGSSFFLFGPRGTGKTTWVGREYPDAHRIDLLDESLYQNYLADAGRFAGELRVLAPRRWVFVDEIQRLPGLLNEVHRHIEAGGLRFILTGSSARKLKRAGVNLLGGRAVYTRMYPFLPHELGNDFDLDTVLRHGSLPVIWNADDRVAALRSYVQLYLKEEIKGEALVRNLAGFARFLPVAALLHGQTLNVASAARDAEVSRTTLTGYVEILEDTLVAFRLPAYDPKLRIRERKHPKLYWIDPGLARAAAGRFRELDPHERGPLFEGWIATVLASYRDYRGTFDEMYYWAPARARDTEVDFLLLRDGDSIAIEAKASARIHDRHLAGLRAVAPLPRLQRRILTYPGTRRMRSPDGIDIWPLTDLLGALETDRLW